MMGVWETRWYRHCKNCGQCNYAGPNATFISDFFQGKTCSGCGEYAGDWISAKTTRTMFRGSIWRPWTWFRFEVQSKGHRDENPSSPHFDPSMNWHHR